MTDTSLPAGRELDALIAEKVFGITTRWRDGSNYGGDPTRYLEYGKQTLGVGTQVPNYSTDILAAWEIVEAMKSNGFQFAIYNIPSGVFTVRFEKDLKLYSMDSETSIPYAICLAALRSDGS